MVITLYGFQGVDSPVDLSVVRKVVMIGGSRLSKRGEYGLSNNAWQSFFRLPDRRLRLEAAQELEERDRDCLHDVSHPPPARPGDRHLMRGLDRTSATSLVC